MSEQMFNYDEFVCRNIGFVSEQEQQQLRAARVLVIGTGGMGGAAVQALARMGINQFALADIDTFELSNLNRQVFANLDTVGHDKAAVTAAALARINPDAEVEVFGTDWPEQMDRLLAEYPVVINGMDDIAMGVHLYRRAAAQGATVIDAYTSPLPSVIVVGPDDPRPEQRLRYPSLGLAAEAMTADVAAACFARELEYVLVHSSSAEHVDLEAATQLTQGRRKRMSFAPMVIATGNMMAFEVAKLVLGRSPRADARGYFFNPWTMRVEHPRSRPVAWVRTHLVRRFIARLTGG